MFLRFIKANGRHRPGDEADVPDGVANLLIARRIAEEHRAAIATPSANDTDSPPPAAVPPQSAPAATTKPAKKPKPKTPKP